MSLNIENIEENHNIYIASNKKKDLYMVYNVENGRLLKTKSSPKKYVIDVLKGNIEDKYIFDFIHIKKNFRWSQITLLSWVVNIMYLKIIVKYMQGILDEKYNKLYCLGLTLYMISIIYTLTSYSQIISLLSASSIVFLLIGFILSDFLITIIHEISHLSVYLKNSSLTRVRMGISFLYGYLFTFFTEVPFIVLDSKQQKKNVILAGIKIQIIIGIILSVLFLSTKNVVFLIPSIANFLSILSNISPFSKLDGYWYISQILNVDSYFKELVLEIKKEAPIRLSILIIGMVNIIMIGISIICFYMSMLNMIK